MGMQTLVDKQDLHGWVKPLAEKRSYRPFRNRFRRLRKHLKPGELVKEFSSNNFVVLELPIEIRSALPNEKELVLTLCLQDTERIKHLLSATLGTSHSA